VIVAAAGNDAIEGKDSETKTKRPGARFPAAFSKVVGVSALDKALALARYSNTSDDPQVDGLAVFGGQAELRDKPEAIVPPGDPDKQVYYAMPDEAVLGIYTDQFPGLVSEVPIESTNGWGWWAGTSFAVPVIAGLMAKAMKQGYTAFQAITCVRGLPDGKTEGDERVIVVQS